MIKTAKTILITSLILVSLTSKVNAAVLKGDNLNSEIKKSIENTLKEAHIKKYDVNITGIPYAQIEIPNGKLKIISSFSNKNYSALNVIKVDVMVNDTKIKTFGVSANIKIYDNVWVFQDNVKKDDCLSYLNLNLEEKEINVGLKNALREQEFSPIGCLTTKNSLRGAVLEKNFIKKPPMIVKNSPVSIIFTTDSVQVVLPGEALEEGNEGDFIKVKNLNYKKDFVGKIIGINTIQVEI